MAIRTTPPLNGARYCADKAAKTVHDLEHETPACRIEDIIVANHAMPLNTLNIAKVLGYSNCQHCIKS